MKLFNGLMPPYSTAQLVFLSALGIIFFSLYLYSYFWDSINRREKRREEYLDQRIKQTHYDLTKNQVEDILNSTPEEMEDKLCKLFPGSDRETINNYVSNTSPNIVLANIAQAVKEDTSSYAESEVEKEMAKSNQEASWFDKLLFLIFFVAVLKFVIDYDLWKVIF